MGRPKEVSDEQILQAARRCFLERGAAISAGEIARDLGISHTTLFNRFGSKHGLILAALSPSNEIPWIAELEAGPDDRPIREQLVALGQVMARYFDDLHAGLMALQAIGIAPAEAFPVSADGEALPVLAFRALIDWLRRAQMTGRLADCDVETLATTILSALNNRAFAACVCGEAVPPDSSDIYVARFIDLLWAGIGTAK